MLRLAKRHVHEITEHARAAAPYECCGLIGGAAGDARSVYKLRNVATDPEVTYEAAPEDLFVAQRRMREAGEQMLAIYHSHPRAAEPLPSETDVRLAYYPSAVYLIVGLGGSEPRLRAFCISERERRWAIAEFEVIDA